MAGPLAAVERFFERLFERPPARLFAPRMEREHIQRELFRAMEADRRVHGRRTYVPTAFRVKLHPTDLAALAADAALTTDLAETLRAHARSRGYVLATRPSVVLEADPALETGELTVSSDAIGAPPAKERQRGPQPPLASHSNEPLPNGHDPARDPGHTSIFEAATPSAPPAMIAVNVPGRAPWRVALTGGRLRLGRARDNDLVLPDDRVSRHHGQISVRFETLVYADLGSTNGSFVNGARVTEIALGPGDVLQVGGSALTVESAP